MTKTVLIRADASAHIGLGHAMRCLAIAEHLILQRVRVVFLTHQPLPQMVEKLHAAGAEIRPAVHAAGMAEDADEVLAVAAELGAHCVMADSYGMGTAYYARLAEQVRLVVLDDEAKVDPLPCHMVINASPAAPSLPYDRLAPGARALLGPAYALVRREFTALRPPHGMAELTGRRSAVVTFGGSDPLALSWPIASGLREHLPGDVTVELVVGAANPLAATIAAHDMDGLVIHVNPPAIAAIFARAGLAVTAAGGTVNELAAMAVPMLSVVVAGNQQLGAESGDFPTLDARHLTHQDIVTRAVALWWDLEARRDLSLRAATRIDGQGSARVADAILAML